jgi:putative photosynthetic complex assembly protein 2
MRLSAKLNIFLGVPNLAHEMLPPRLGYLKSYFRRRRFNFVFPLSVALSVWGAFTVGGIAFSGTASGAEATGAMLLLSILLLGLLEHFFMVLPIQDSALWRWAMTAHAAPAGERRDPPRP